MPRSAIAATQHPVIAPAAVNRRGKSVELQIAASPMRTEEGGISGIILVIDQRAPQPAKT